MKCPQGVFRYLALGSSALLIALALSACTPEDYGPCTLPSSEALDEACSPSSEDGAAASCVVDFVFECETQLCGTYDGSDPFCTERCEPDGDPCPKDGVCLEWVPGLGEYYCVPQEMAPVIVDDNTQDEADTES